MYKRYINSTIIIIIIVWVTAETIFFDVISAKRYCHVKEQAVCVTTFDQSEWVESDFRAWKEPFSDMFMVKLSLYSILV